MKTNIDLARECGAKTLIRCKDGNLEITMTQAQLDTFAERIRADERERCAAIAEQMTAHSRKTRAVLIGAVTPDCPVAAAIRNL